MVAPSQKGIFITRYEAIRNFVVTTIAYAAIIFRREIFAWQQGVTVDELYAFKPAGTFTTVIGSIYYFGFLFFWCLSVFDSYKHFRKKQRDLKLLLEEQQQYRDNMQKFTYPPSTSVIANKKIFQQGDWIAYVSHEIDADWQFHTVDNEVSESDVQIVSLEAIVNHDSSVSKLADLPIGWQAWRDSAMSDWKKSPL